MASLTGENLLKELEFLIEIGQDTTIDLSNKDRKVIRQFFDKYSPIVINPTIPLKDLPLMLGCEKQHNDELESFLLSLDILDAKPIGRKVIIFEDFEKFSYPHFYEGLRGTIQHHNNIIYIFLVNTHEDIVEIFCKTKNPFFRFARTL